MRLILHLLFQSTHPHGVRRVHVRSFLPMTGFNPRTHTGCDLLPLLLLISRNSFNPRTHTGCDVKFLHNNFIQSMFQSTHPHGVRLLRNKPRICRSSFNPRTHTGCDKCTRSKFSTDDWFQSTHPHGVRHIMISTALASGSFNPRTHTGCDLPTPKNVHIVICFNPRTHTGCDNDYYRFSQWENVSIHAPTRGATQGNGKFDFEVRVSIHAPTRGATWWSSK